MGRNTITWSRTLSFPTNLSTGGSEERGFYRQKSAVQETRSIVCNCPACEMIEYGSINCWKRRHNVNQKCANTSQNTSRTSCNGSLSSERSLISSYVYCIHHKEGCDWADELRCLKGHLMTCKYDATPCTAHCGAKISRFMMADHLKFTCPRRRVVCEHCHGDFSGEQYENHVGTCSLEPIYCDNKCGQKVPRRVLGHHKTVECSKRLLPCRFCGKEFVADTLQAHHGKCCRFPITCPQGCETADLVREDMDSHLKESCPALTVNCSFKEAGCRFKGPRYAVEKHEEDSMRQHLGLMCSFAVRQQQQLTTLRSQISRMNLNYSGTLVWKISDYSTRLAEAKLKEGFELISPPFYTSQYGYKLQASVFLNGNGSGENSHLSVYIKILPGEYDALLKWPFAHTVSFTLHDQTSNPEAACNIVESFIPDPTWENFQRPSREPDALGFGFPRFVSHEMLKKRHFIKDDILFLRVKVDANKVVAV
ncbi:TNF receptor-associated factor 4-like isoform X1 [Artemia franciscana]|uniref:TNF receptor-associated factor 4 n=1 Tax=Artemia franciscana TaxID=6661 RepID=A0AA88HNR0_ARTSF|nr:hypothetical protein QYM36_012254 [Artemia franciscana]